MLGLLLFARPVLAQIPDAPAPAPPADEAARLEQAKELFRQGNELRKVGDFQRALHFYRRSRELVPSVPNTLNAAYCLQQLGRHDEALELYEELLTGFAGKLGDEDKQAVASATQSLRPKVGSIDVSANVTGQLVIDGRMRGTLPLPSAVRVLPGERTVRVLKEGYETFEARVSVEVGETLRVDAKLARLRSAGRLRVDDPTLAGGELYVDGALVGAVPWEGTLSPGKHLFFVRKGDVGTAPAEAVVIDGQTVVLHTRAQTLSRELRIVVDPPSAELTLDGVPLGRGNWLGRLPVGAHVVEAREEGYQAGRLLVTASATTAGDMPLALKVDREHPRWASAERPRLFVEGLFGWAFASSLDSQVEASCDAGRCSENRVASGPIVAVRGGYQLGIGLALELSAGYLSLSKSLSRRIEVSFEQQQVKIPVHYSLSDELSLRGPFASVGIAYRHELGDSFGMGFRLHAGGMLAESRDRLSGTARTTGRAVPVNVENSGQPVAAAALLLMPGAEIRFKLGALHIGAGVMAPFLVLEGPRNEHGELSVDRTNCSDPLTDVECLPGQRVVSEERSHGRFFAVAPTLSCGYTF